MDTIETNETVKSALDIPYIAGVMREEMEKLGKGFACTIADRYYKPVFVNHASGVGAVGDTIGEAAQSCMKLVVSTPERIAALRAQIEALEKEEV